VIFGLGYTFDAQGGKPISPSYLVRSLDRGMTWDRVDIPILSEPSSWEYLAFIDSLSGWIETFYMGVARTRDGGHSWEWLIPDSSRDPNQYYAPLTFIDSSNGWIGGTYRTRDGGRTWDAPFDAYNTGFGYASPTHIFVSGAHDDARGSNYLWESLDGGYTWIERLTPGGLFDVVSCPDSMHCWFHGTMYTFDGGKTFVCCDSLQQSYGTTWQFVDSVHGWASMNDELIRYHPADEVETAARELPVARWVVPPPSSSILAYPNPVTNSHSQIEFFVDRGGEVVLALSDVIARQRRVVLAARVSAGTHAVPINTSDLSRGIYLIEERVDGRLVGVGTVSVVR
jgi:hypothetical protein